MSAVYATSTSKSEKGEAVEIIGANGAGKSTLLVLGGRCDRAGPEDDRGSRAGRESIVLKGVLMGLTRRQVVERMAAIVAFSALEAWSGRADPYLLEWNGLIDEILAVGGRSLPGPVL